MKKIIQFLLIYFALFFVQETNAKPILSWDENRKVQHDERLGVKYHKRGDFKKAFKHLKHPAEEGMKQSQYLLGFMFLRGEYVEQSILEGLGWLGVANELEVDDWRNTFDSIYGRVSQAQKELIDVKIAEYIELYGLSTQQVSCSKKGRAGSRNVKVFCVKRVRTSTLVTY